MVLPVDRRTPAKKLTAALLIKLVRHPVPPRGRSEREGFQSTKDD